MFQFKRLLAALTAVAVSVLILATGQPAVAASPYNNRTAAAPNGQWCMDVTDVSQANGARIQLYQCLGPNQMNQRWYFFPVPNSGNPSNYQIVAAHSGKCLDVTDYSLSDMAVLQQWECLGYGQTNQLWRMVYDGGQNMMWQSVYSGLYLSYGPTWPYNGTPVVQSQFSRWWITTGP